MTESGHTHVDMLEGRKMQRDDRRRKINRKKRVKNNEKEGIRERVKDPSRFEIARAHPRVANLGPKHVSWVWVTPRTLKAVVYFRLSQRTSWEIPTRTSEARGSQRRVMTALHVRRMWASKSSFIAWSYIELIRIFFVRQTYTAAQDSDCSEIDLKG